MIKKNKVHDIALVALSQHHGFPCRKQSDGSWYVQVDDRRWVELQQLFKVQYLPVLKRMRRLEQSPNCESSN